MFLPRLALLALTAFSPNDLGPSRLDVEPAEARLRGSDSLTQLVVTGVGPGERAVDLTASVRYESSDPKVATVDRDGLVRPVGDGRAEVRVRSGEGIATVRVVVEDFANTRPVPFGAEVVPIFSKSGCNAGGCHGKASGQNGFRLSLLGFDPDFDYAALVREGRGRRIFPADPKSSLLLTKATASVPHGGGRKIQVGSPEYRTIERWIGQGMPRDTGKEARLTRIDVSPSRRLLGRKDRQQVRVTAHYDDGTSADVTRLAQYQSNAVALASVGETGKIQVADGAGEAAIMARFGGQVAVAHVTVPLGLEIPAWEDPPSRNLIDPFVFGKLRALGIPPSATCTDAEFARRSALDVCGVLPTPEEVVAFENDPRPDKRTRWVEQLVERPEYADYFAMKWSAILRNKRLPFGPTDSGTFTFHAWIRQSLAENKPYDQFAAEILAATGDVGQSPAVVWYRQLNRKDEDVVDDTAQLFLGLRIQCARCHHHPFEKWGQDDYYGFAAFFSRIGRKGGGSDPLTGRVYVLPAGRATNPTNNRSYDPKPLGGPEMKDLGPRQDPRQSLVDWLKRDDNPFFARAVVNRYWKHFFNRGLVEPEDDIRISNPPANPELLDALAHDFIQSGYDLKRLVRTIATSRAYDRSSLPNEFNAGDRQNFARYYPRRLPAEVLLDAIDEVTGVPERFNGLPKGFRAAQLPDDGFSSDFLDVFGRPKRESVCECERSSEANLSQSLHLLNSAEVQRKLADGSGRVARWAEKPMPDVETIEALYRLCYARPPTTEEREIALAHLARRRSENQVRQGFEDLVWTLINTKEFLFNR